MTEEDSEIRLGTCNINLCHVVGPLLAYCLFAVPMCSKNRGGLLMIYYANVLL